MACQLPPHSIIRQIWNGRIGNDEIKLLFTGTEKTAASAVTRFCIGRLLKATRSSSLALNRKGLAVIGAPSPDDFRDIDYGPTFFYTLQGGQFVVSSALSGGSLPATSLGITDKYLITGSVANAGAGGTF